MKRLLPCSSAGHTTFHPRARTLEFLLLNVELKTIASSFYDEFKAHVRKEVMLLDETR